MIMNNATIGAAVLGGYLLGRTKKAKLALGVGAMLAGSKVRPGQLGKVLDSQFLGDVTRQVRGELTGASKAAATSVLTAKADSLAGALHERTEGLRQRAQGDGGEGQEGRSEEDESAEDASAEDESAEDESADEDEQQQRKSASHRKSESRPKKKTAAASRSRSGSTSRSRRQDDG